MIFYGALLVGGVHFFGEFLDGFLSFNLLIYICFLFCVARGKDKAK